MPKLIQELPDTVSSGQLASKVKNYFDYISGKVGPGRDVFIADLFTREVLLALLDQDCDGLRFYLAREDKVDKDGADQQGKITMMAIPVKQEGGTYVEQLTEDNLVCHIECRSTHCEPRKYINDENDVFS